MLAVPRLLVMARLLVVARLLAMLTGMPGCMRHSGELLRGRPGVLPVERGTLGVLGPRPVGGRVLTVAAWSTFCTIGRVQALSFVGQPLLRLVFPRSETLRTLRPSRRISGPPCRISVLRSCARYWVLSHWTSFPPRLH